MHRNTIIGLIALAVVLGGLGWYAGTRQGQTLPGISAASLPAQPPYRETAPVWKIIANYPTSTPLIGSANDSAMALMRSFIADTIMQFKKGAQGAPNQTGLSLDLVYLIGSSPRTVSYIYTIYEDTGGAHGMTYFKTFVFDTKTGTHLSLVDLFAPGSTYLQTLSSLARAKLPGVIGQYADPQMIQNGTTPDEKNFENFFIDNHNIDFLFPPYQVAAYAQGPVTLQIPMAELPGIKPEYK